MTAKSTKARKPRQPKQEISPVYAMGTVRYGEGVNRAFTYNQTDAALVARCVQQTLAWAVSFNAVACAQQRLRLFRSTKAKGKGLWRGRAVGRKQLRFLRGEGLYNAGVKAAEWANEGDVEEVLDHPALDLFRHPDPFQTGTDFMVMHYWYKEGPGRAYTYKGDRLGNEPVALYNLPPQFTVVQPDPVQFIRGYHYGRNTAAAQFFPVEDVIYHRHMVNPQNPLEAMSWPYALQMEADCEQAAVQAEVARWNNGGQPGMIVSIDGPPPTDSQRRQIEVDWANQVRGVAKSGGAFFIFGKTTVKDGAPAKDMGYVEGLAKIEKRIYRAAGIPDSIVDMSKSNLANAYRADPQYTGQTVLPRINKSAEEFNEWLLPEFGIEAGEYFFAYDNPVAEDEVAAVDRGVKLVTAGIIKREVIAAELGYLPEDVGVDPNAVADPETDGEVDPEADPKADPATPGATVAAAGSGTVQQEALNGTQQTALMDMVARAAKEEIPYESARAIAALAFPLATPEQLDAIFNPLKGFKPKEDPAKVVADPGSDPDKDPPKPDKPEPGAKRLEPGEPGGSLGTHERGGAKAAGATDGGDGADPEAGARVIEEGAAFCRSIGLLGSDLASRSGCCGGHSPDHGSKQAPLTGQPRQITDALSKMSAELEAWLRRVYPQAIRDDGTIDLTGFEQELQELMAPHLRAVMQASGQDAANEVGGTWGGIEANPRAVAYLQAHGAEMVRNIAQTTREQLQTVLSEGFAKGDTLIDIQARIREQAPEMSAQRAEVIARTETSAAAGEGAMLAYKENGVAARALLNGGGPCPICDAVAAKGAVPIDQPLVQAGEDVGGYVFTRAVYSNPVHPNCRCTVVPEFEEGDE